MPWWFLAKRKRVDEWMDRSDVPADEHAQALVGLARINAASHAARTVQRIILRHLAPQSPHSPHSPPRTLHLMDVACGAGDVPVRVASALRRRGFEVRLTLCDRSMTALDVARRHAEAAGFGDLTVLSLDVTRSPLPQADVVTCSLFLHHLERAEVLRVLRALRQATTELLIVNDLRRSFTGWIVARVGCFLLTRSRIVRYDGPLSARAAWTRRELREMAEQAGISDAAVVRAPRWRMCLIWRKR